jgi:YegS/Rv2252/BmrU family lipid kinase
VHRSRRALTRLDRRLLTFATNHHSPLADWLMVTASNTANRSMLWSAVAAGLTATGRRRPRTAAASGLLGIGIAATLVNGPLKFAWRRDRPATMFTDKEPLLPLPRTFSFPSGHSASAFAFATGATGALPAAGAALFPMAGTVAYSRAYTGVHYPSDVVVGAAVGAASGLVAAKVVGRLRESSMHEVDAPALDVRLPPDAVLLTSDSAGSADALDVTKRALDEAGVRVTEVVGLEQVDGVRELVNGVAQPPLVIAAGGDGTVCAAANAIVDSDAVLAIIPLGTSNDVARSLGIPPDPVEAADVIANGRVCPVDVARVRSGNGPRVFLNAATAGLNVAFARLATDSKLRDSLGGLNYPIAAARALRDYEPFECTLEYDGRQQRLQAVHVSISNAPVFGGVLGMRVPGSSMTDGMLDVIVIERLSIARLAVAVGDTLIGQHRPVHGVHTMQVRSIKVDATPTQEIALDGEVVGELPVEVAADRGALRVVVPQPRA